jgi:hypothetical protein
VGAQNPWHFSAQPRLAAKRVGEGDAAAFDSIAVSSSTPTKSFKGDANSIGICAGAFLKW